MNLFGKTVLVNLNFKALDRQGCLGHGVISRLESALLVILSRDLSG